jgi:hypothetical protein
MYESFTAVSYGDMSRGPSVSDVLGSAGSVRAEERVGCRAAYAVSAARIPDFIALCVPLIC